MVIKDCLEIKFIKIIGIAQIRLVGGAVEELEHQLVLARDMDKFTLLGNDGLGGFIGCWLIDPDPVQQITVHPVNKNDVFIKGIDKTAGLQHG